MLKGLLCDIDGDSLVDSNVLHAEAWVWAFAHFGYRFSLDDVLHQIGKDISTRSKLFREHELCSKGCAEAGFALR